MALRSMNKSIFTTIALLFFNLPVNALDVPTADDLAATEAAFQLGRGITVGPKKSVVYALETRGLTARATADGAVLWQRGLEQPLGFYGTWLVSFIPGADSAAELLFIDARTGEVEERITLEFPASANPTLQNLPNQRFWIEIRRVAGDLSVYWEQHARPLRGMPVLASGLPPAPSLNAAAKTSNLQSIEVSDSGHTRSSGAFRINPSEVSAERIDVESLPPPSAFVPDIAAAGRGSTDVARTFRASDTEHRLDSTVIDAAAWNRYKWQLVNTRTDEFAGSIELPWAYAPFFVNERLITFFSPPYIRRQKDEAGFISFGPKLNVVSLTDGRTIWSTAVLEQEYRGEQPP